MADSSEPVDAPEMGRPSLPTTAAAGAGRARLEAAAADAVGVTGTIVEEGTASVGARADAPLGVAWGSDGVVDAGTALIADTGVAAAETGAAAALGVTATVAAAVGVAGCDNTAALGVVAAAAAIGVAMMADASDELLASSLSGTGDDVEIELATSTGLLVSLPEPSTTHQPAERVF